MVPRVKDMLQPPWHAKDRILDFDEERLTRGASETLIFQNENI